MASKMRQRARFRTDNHPRSPLCFQAWIPPPSPSWNPSLDNSANFSPCMYLSSVSSLEKITDLPQIMGRPRGGNGLQKGSLAHPSTLTRRCPTFNVSFHSVFTMNWPSAIQHKLIWYRCKALPPAGQSFLQQQWYDQAWARIRLPAIAVYHHAPEIRLQLKVYR